MANILGIAGGPNIVGAVPLISGISPLFFHDSAACLIVNGKVVCAIEEERFSRIKHTNGFPVHAIRACLESAAIQLSDIDNVAYFFEESFCDAEFRRVARESGGSEAMSAREMIDVNLMEALGTEVPPRSVKFTNHHAAHAAAVHHASQFADCLIVVIDGRGESESVSILRGEGRTEREVLETYPVAASPGFFFRKVTKILGFGEHDEYKVMGLAPYGNPKRFERLMRQIYEPPSRGTKLSLNHEALEALAAAEGVLPRPSGESITQNHKDFAASSQYLLERVLFDVVNLWQTTTRSRQLCLVGGVAHNCRANGVIARSGKFDAIYVHPASHDAGTAIGAALVVSDELRGAGATRGTGRFTPFLGTRIDSDGDGGSEKTLVPWRAVLQWHKPPNLHEMVAQCIAAGEVVGWARGRAEFGPRALGARSILADPRPRANWERINKVIKKREGFRPFAPSVCEESAGLYFELPVTRCNLGEMGFTVPVREDWRVTLGAVTHVDSSARVQVVSRQDNPDFWKLIKLFGQQTGIDVLLNTSFNHSSEPIVNSANDAVRTFLTTDIDLLILGPYAVRKHTSIMSELSRCHLLLTSGTEFTHSLTDDGEFSGVFRRGGQAIAASRLLAAGLKNDCQADLSDLFQYPENPANEMLRNEIMRLWENRMIDLFPLTAHE